MFREAGREVAPIRLTDRNVRHALENHNNIFKSIEDVLEYVNYVLQNANVMRRTNNSSIYVSIEIEENPDKTALLRLYLSDYGDYYNVETVGDRRKNFWNGKEYEIIARRSEPSKIDAVSKSARPAPQLNKNGNEESNATEAIISDRKGTANSRADQTNSEKNSGNLQGGDDVRFSIEGDGEIEDIDLNEAYELSEEADYI